MALSENITVTWRRSACLEGATPIFHLAAVEPHGAVMAALSPKPVKLAVRLFVVMVCAENAESTGVGGETNERGDRQCLSVS
jgi:hypothetical protein